MNQLTTAKRVAIISALVEGNSLRSTTRMVGLLDQHGYQAPGGRGRSVRPLPTRDDPQTSFAVASSATKSGISAFASRRTSRPTRPVSWGTASSGPGRGCVPDTKIGPDVAGRFRAIRSTHTPSSRIWQAVLSHRIQLYFTRPKSETSSNCWKLSVISVAMVSHGWSQSHRASPRWPLETRQTSDGSGRKGPDAW